MFGGAYSETPWCRVLYSCNGEYGAERNPKTNQYANETVKVGGNVKQQIHALANQVSPCVKVSVSSLVIPPWNLAWSMAASPVGLDLAS